MDMSVFTYVREQEGTWRPRVAAHTMPQSAGAAPLTAEATICPAPLTAPSFPAGADWFTSTTATATASCQCNAQLPRRCRLILKHDCDTNSRLSMRHQVPHRGRLIHKHSCDGNSILSMQRPAWSQVLPVSQAQLRQQQRVAHAACGVVVREH